MSTEAVTRFDLEQALLDTWGTTESNIKVAIRSLEQSGDDENLEIMKVILKIYLSQMEHTFSIFEQTIKSREL